MKRIDANDLDEKAAAAVRRNLEYNDPKASGLVRPTQGDVRLMALQVGGDIYGLLLFFNFLCFIYFLYIIIYYY